jgi:methyl-accepting chemotaxis protein
MGNKHRKLRNIVIDGPLQSKIIVLVVGFVFLQSLLLSWYLFFFSRSLNNDISNGEATFDSILDMLQSMIYGVTIANIGFILFAFVLSLYFSHKIAGPIYAIKRAINNLLEGVEHRDVILRKGDEFHDLANRINKLFTIFKIEPDKKD